MPHRNRPASLCDVVPFLPIAVGRKQTYTYRAPAETVLRPGLLVRVPVGTRSVDGIVLRTTTRTRVPAGRLKSVLRVISEAPLFTSAELSALQELADLSLESFAGLLKSAASVRRPLTRTPALTYEVTMRAPNLGGLEVRVAWGPLADTLPSAPSGQTLILVPELAIGAHVRKSLAERGVSSVLFAQARRVRERRALLEQLARGDEATVVATHAGIFLPFPALARIFVIEAALPSHRQWDLHPRYDARVGALLLARARGVPLTLQSSLPSLDLYHLSQHPKSKQSLPHTLYTLHPEVRIIPRTASDSLLTPDALRSIREGLQNNECILLFHDIVGTERLYTCDTCGMSLRCEQCGGILERAGTNLKCRLCGASSGTPLSFCPRCRSPHFGPRRVGTTAITSLLRHVFPETPLTRLDRETIGRGGISVPSTSSHQPSIVVASERSFSVLESATVDRVIILDLDRVLEDDTFDASERFLQILGRLATLRRGDAPLLVQTRHPHLSLIKTLAQPNRMSDWLSDERADRETLRYPPAAALILLEKYFPTTAVAERTVRRVAREFMDASGVRIGYRIIGGMRPRAEIVLRGSVEALKRTLPYLPSGWSTDPHLPLSVLLR